MALPLLISCGNVPQEVMAPVEVNKGKVTLECLVPFDEVKKEEAFKNFETDVLAIFPEYDIHLSFVKGDANAYNTKIKVMLSSDTPPDIFYSGDEDFTSELSASSIIKPLEKNLKDMDYFNTVIPSAKLAGDAGHIFAVPIDEAYYSIMLINTEIFSQNGVTIPSNFEELKGAVKQFNAKGITPIAISGKSGTYLYNMLEGFACTIDNIITSKIISGKDTFSGEIFKQAATAVNQLIELDAFEEEAENVSDEEAANLFYSSKAAIYSTTSDKLNMASGKLKGKAAILYYPSPGKPDQSVLNDIVSGGIKKDSGLVVSSSTSYSSEAAKVAVEMSKYYNKYLYEKEGNSSIIYNTDNTDFKTSLVMNPLLGELLMNVKQEGKVNTGLFNNNISAAKEKTIKEASEGFITGILSVSDYLKEMDIAIKSK